MSKKKEKVYDEVGYWTTQLETLESKKECKHHFAISFTIEQKIDYCKRMLSNIELKKSL
jgi:hypothetical protein